MSKVTDFIESLPIIQNQSGELYGYAPTDLMQQVFDILKDKYDLTDKRLLDFGSGDLRLSLLAINDYGMKATAVEINPRISDIGTQVREQAENQGLCNANNLLYYPSTDGLSIDWSDIDFVVLSYIEPLTDEAEAKKFRDAFINKLYYNTKKGCIFAIYFFPEFYSAQTNIGSIFIDVTEPKQLEHSKMSEWGMPYLRIFVNK